MPGHQSYMLGVWREQTELDVPSPALNGCHLKQLDEDQHKAQQTSSAKRST